MPREKVKFACDLAVGRVIIIVAGCFICWKIACETKPRAHEEGFNQTAPPAKSDRTKIGW